MFKKDALLSYLRHKVLRNDTYRNDNILTKTLKNIMFINMHILLPNYKSQPTKQIDPYGKQSLS
jgi:hypothetical protein